MIDYVKKLAELIKFKPKYIEAYNDTRYYYDSYHEAVTKIAEAYGDSYREAQKDFHNKCVKALYPDLRDNDNLVLLLFIAIGAFKSIMFMIPEKEELDVDADIIIKRIYERASDCVTVKKDIFLEKCRKANFNWYSAYELHQT